MKHLLFVLLSFFYVQAHAQDSTTIVNLDTLDVEFTEVEVPAKFPAGANAWNEFLVRNIRQQTPAKHKAPAGTYSVVVSFLADKEGNVGDIGILVDPGYGTAEDVIRVLHKSPRWIPAMQHGRNVIYRQKQVISYEVSKR